MAASCGRLQFGTVTGAIVQVLAQVDSDLRVRTFTLGSSIYWLAASIAKHLCGFANAVDYGYLLLGFERDGDAWKASGLDFPGGDPPVWVSGIAGTLRPRPRIDVRDWLAGGKRAAVVRIEPAAEPPCMTRGGQVFERVSGALAAAAFAETFEPPEPPYLVISGARAGRPPARHLVATVRSLVR